VAQFPSHQLAGSVTNAMGDVVSGNVENAAVIEDAARPVLPPSRPLAEPIRLGSPPALRTAIWTCLRNGCVRGLMRAPPLRDRPGLTLKFSLSSRAMTRRLASEIAGTRASEHRSHQIALARMMAKK
jgi:hypothetical protein